MGASLDIRKVQAVTEAELRTAFVDIRDQSRWSDGHSYSGQLGMKSTVHIIPPPKGSIYWNLDDAEDHLEENDKWDEEAWAYRLSSNTWIIGGWCPS